LDIKLKMFSFDTTELHPTKNDPGLPMVSVWIFLSSFDLFPHFVSSFSSSIFFSSLNKPMNQQFCRHTPTVHSARLSLFAGAVGPPLRLHCPPWTSPSPVD
jgi:hypothetical protein